MNKIFCILFVLFNLLTTFENIVYAASDDTINVIERQNEVVSYGIIKGDPDGNLRLNDCMTRAEFAAVSCRLLNLDITEPKNSMFLDVSEDFWGYAYINTAYNNGIINGYGDNTFKPNEFISYEEALKIIVCSLGYSQKAEQYAAYPYGYKLCATELGVTKNLKTSDGQKITREDVIELVYNSLDVPMNKNGTIETITIRSNLKP